MAVSIQMIEYGSTMATRQRGEELRAKVLDIAGQDSHVVLDFEGVLSVSSSFADELIGRLAVGDGSGGTDNRTIGVINAREEVRQVLDSVLERRRNFDPSRRSAVEKRAWQELNAVDSLPSRLVAD